MKSFISGSYAYGRPGLKSDIDLVCLLSPADLRLLKNASGLQKSGNDLPGSTECLRFGDLNLICCTEQLHYEVWKIGTEQLKEAAPVTRDEAVLKFKQLREANGVVFDYDELE